MAADASHFLDPGMMALMLGNNLATAFVFPGMTILSTVAASILLLGV